MKRTFSLCLCCFAALASWSLRIASPNPGAAVPEAEARNIWGGGCVMAGTLTPTCCPGNQTMRPIVVPSPMGFGTNIDDCVVGIEDCPYTYVTSNSCGST